MSFEVSGPAEGRGGKKDLEEETSDRSISNFNFCYKMPKKNDDSDEEHVQKKEECFSVNFEDRDKSSSEHRKSYCKYGKTKQDLYEQLTERSKAALEDIEIYLLDKIEKGESLPEVTEVCKRLRIMTAAPQVEFDDFEKLRNYNLGISRLGTGTNSIPMPKLPIIVYNNLTSLMMLFVDTNTNDMALKPLYSPRQGELITCLGVGSQKYENCVIAACMHQYSLVFIDLQTESILFCLPLDSSSDSGEVTAITTFNQRALVFFEDWSVRIIDIESAEVTKSFSVPKDLVSESDFLQGVIVHRNRVVAQLNNRLLVIDPENETYEVVKAFIQNINFDSPSDSELCFTKALDEWIVAGTLGQSELRAINLSTKKSLALSLGQSQIVSIGSRLNSSEVFILAETQTEEPTGPQSVKQVFIVDIGLQGDHIVDRFEVFPEARSLHVIEDSQLVIVEGNQYFNLFSTNDKKLAEKIIQGLYSTNQARVEEGTPYLYEQPSTKGNTNASSPNPEIGSNQSSGLQSSENQLVPERIDRIIELRISSSAENPLAVSETLKEVETRLISIIDERLLKFKEVIKNQVIEEFKAQYMDQVKLAVKEEVALQLGRANRTHPYTIKVHTEEEDASNLLRKENDN